MESKEYLDAVFKAVEDALIAVIMYRQVNNPAPILISPKEIQKMLKENQGDKKNGK